VSAAVLDDVDEVVGAFYPGLTHSLYGESESGKSWIAQWAVIEALANGLKVLYVDFESSADQIVPRFVALAAGMGVDLRAALVEGLLVYVQPQGRITQTFIDDYLHPDRFALAVIDGVTASIAMWGKGSNSGDEFTQWHHDLPERIARATGAAVVVIDHVAKPGGNGGNSRFAIGSQAKMAVLTGAAYLVDVETPFAPGRPGKVVMRVAKDRPGDVRAHSGKVTANRLQPWARVTIDGTSDGAKITLAFEPIDDDDEQLDDLPGGRFDVPNWKDVAVPDEVVELLKGRGSARAADVVRILWAVGTVDGLTEAAIRQTWIEAQGEMRNPAARWREAWACVDAAQAVAHGAGGTSRWVLSSNFEHLLGEHNPRS
jgi:hypothetical protein